MRYPVRTPSYGCEHCGFVADDGKLWICQPLSPSQNVFQRLHWSAFRTYKGACYFVTLAQARALLSPFRKPWAQHVRLSIIRCSPGRHPADRTNVVGGAKIAIDTIIDRNGGVGIIPDDAPEFLELGAVEDRRKGHWRGLAGPATWLVLERLDVAQ